MKLMDIFYGISSDILQSLMIDTLNFVNKMKELKEEKNLDEKESESSSEDNNNLRSISNNSLNSVGINNQNKTNKKNRITTNNKLFMMFLGFGLSILYIYFVYNWIYFISIIKKAETILEFGYAFHEYQNKITELFNVYREFLYDNETKIMNHYAFDYLRNVEIEIYDKIREQSVKTDQFILKLIFENFELSQDLSVDYCFYKENDYFDSLEECNSTFGYVFEFSHHLLYNYFLEEIRIKKNIVRYKLKNEKIKGDLYNFNRDKFINEYEKDKNIEFRLNLFNDKALHFKLNLYYIHSILPYLRHNRDAIYKFVSIDGEEHFFNLLSIIYSLVLSLIFFGFFIFILKQLNDQIYKTKKMLSIFPIHILVSQNNKEFLYNLFVNK